MQIHVGTSGFSYPAWKGAFYPEDLPDKDMLGWYAQRLNSVEVNNTFYRMPRPAMLEAWAARVPAGFRFALKAPQRITHRQRLRGVEDSVAYLLQVAGALGDRLGPLLFQLPPRFKRDTALLDEFLAQLPGTCRAAFEFRDPSWFDEEVLELLRDHRAALCIAEADDGPDSPRTATADWGYLRLRRTDYDEARLSAWADWVGAQDWRDAFVFFKHEDQAKGPKYAQAFLERIGRDAP